MQYNNKKGISLIEVITVIAIIGILTVLVVPPLSDFKNRQLIRSTTEELSGFIQETRSKTLSSHDSLAYGVHFDEDQVVQFSGSTYVSGDSDNIVFPIVSNITVSDISLAGGGDNIFFERLTGQTDEYGTITLTLIVSGAQKTISVSALGIVNSN